MTSRINVIPGKLQKNIEKTVDNKNQIAYSTNFYQDEDPQTRAEKDDLDTRQIQETERFHTENTKNPPTGLTFEEMADLVDLNSRLSRCIHTYAMNTVGLGWEVKLKEGVRNSDKSSKAKRQKQLVEDLLSFPSPKRSFTTIMKLTKSDEEAIGNGYIEVVRNMKGEIQRLHNIKGQTVKVREEESEGYQQEVLEDERYFKRFGDMRIMKTDDGEFVEREEDGLGEATGEIPDFEQQASELIHFKKHNPRSQFYGIPRWLPAIPAIVGNRKAAERNVNFFDNDGVPRMMVQVEGGTLSDDSQENIQNFVNREHKGIDNAHRVMVLESVTQEESIGPESGFGMQNQNKSSINVEPLTVGMEEDASFLDYRKANDEEIREIFGISEAFFSTSDVNRSSAEVSRAITNEQEFEPDRKEKEFKINNTIIRDIVTRDQLPDEYKSENLEELRLEKPEIFEDIEVLVEIEFNSPTIGNPKEDQASILSDYTEMGALTVNEVREELDRDPFPDEFVFADQPLPIAQSMLQAGIQTPISSNSGETEPEDRSEGKRSNNSNRGQKDSEPSDNEEESYKNNENDNLQNVSTLLSVNTDEVEKKLDFIHKLNNLSGDKLDKLMKLLDKME